MDYLVIKGNYHAYSDKVQDAIRQIKKELMANKESKLINNPYYKVYDVTEVAEGDTIAVCDDFITYEGDGFTILSEPIIMTHFEAIKLDLPA